MVSDAMSGKVFHKRECYSKFVLQRKVVEIEWEKTLATYWRRLAENRCSDDITMRIQTFTNENGNS